MQLTLGVISVKIRRPKGIALLSYSKIQVNGVVICQLRTYERIPICLRKMHLAPNGTTKVKNIFGTAKGFYRKNWKH